MARAQIVMADAQFGTERFLRPNANFTDDYQGVSAASTPIFVYPGSRPLDPQAGRPGYDPDLIRGLSVPVGARLIVKIPNIPYVESTGPSVFRGYIWAFIWRERNLFDYRTQRIPWHLPQGRGPDDTSGPDPEARVLLPATANTVIYNQPEPISAILPDSGRAVQRVRAEDLRFSTIGIPGPLLPSGATGVIQQGVLDPATFGVGANQQTFMSHELQALEDELLIAIYRDTGPTNWDFTAGTGADEQLGVLLGNTTAADTSRVGVYVKAGSAP